MDKIRLSQKMDENKALTSIRKFTLSKTFMIIQALIAAAFIIARGKGNIMPLVYGDIVLTIMLSLILVLCDDIMATLMPFLLICCISIKCYDSFHVFIKLAPFVPIPLFAFLFHFIVYRCKFDAGKTWKGAAAVAVAVTLGGVGKISAAEYFSPTALFYTFGLGIGMLGIYFLMNSHYKAESPYYVTRFQFSYIMTVVGVFCVFMILHHYALFWENFLNKLSPIYFQWRNNVSTILMLTMPFSFFLSAQKYPFIFLGVLQYAGILLTGSRGGALGGTIEFALCLFAVVYSDRKHRKVNLIIIASVVFTALTFFLKPLLDFFAPVLLRFAGGDEVRESLITRALDDFKSNILFGRGLGYIGNNDVHSPPTFAITWYHSSPFQIIGSFGLTGVVCFAYQLYNRMSVNWKRITHFNISLFISYAGLFIMSLVNPGEFCPVPYGLMATLLFILCDKNNIAAAECDNTDTSDEQEEVIKLEI